jgi:hypothetical protein
MDKAIRKCIAAFRRIIVLLIAVQLLLFTLVPRLHAAAVAMTTHHNDNARTGANLNETILNTRNVNRARFGKLFVHAVDDDIFTQALYVPGLVIPNKGRHNVVYVATQNNSVYAFDADNNQGSNAEPLWQVGFTDPAVGIIPVPEEEIGNPGEGNLRRNGNVGIMGTPVIDINSKTMYLVARTKESTTFVQKLHALDLRTGAEKFGGPVRIAATVAGTGYGSNGGKLKFEPRIHNQRAGLALGNGAVYISWASHGDAGLYHGWVIAYDAQSLKKTGIFNVSPNGFQGGIWQSGQPPVLDAAGSVYVATGNGSFSASIGGSDFGQSIVKLAPRSLAVMDWFTPDNWDALNIADVDVNASGLLLLPGERRLVTGDKESRVFLLDTANLGHLLPGNVQAVQSINVNDGGRLFGSPVYYNSPSRGSLVYFWGQADYLKAYAFNGSAMGSDPVMHSHFAAAGSMPGGAALSLSANGSVPDTGILWAAQPNGGDAEAGIVPGVLRAFDASQLSRELWNSVQNPARDDVGNHAKFVPPTIANGRVYLPTFSGQLAVYGLLNPAVYATPKTAVLRVVTKGSGTGQVVSVPAGIDCGTQCRKRFPVGSIVSLTANPSGAASFSGWLGACRNKRNPCRVKVTTDRKITAIFR